VRSAQPIGFPRHDEVHVWLANLDRAAFAREALDRWLSGEERARAAAFRRARDRRRFSASRAQLRALLGRYLEVDPARLRLELRAGGKPALAADSRAEGLEFNVSHAGERAVFAIAFDRPVGVDIEQVRGDLDIQRMARIAFSERERERLGRLDAGSRAAAFLAAWTRKEAVLKARGDGLVGSWDEVEAPPSGWRVEDLTLDGGYVGAVAARGHGWSALLLRVSEDRLISGGA
jgi:4'-phosphopantetheinyl transferase